MEEILKRRKRKRATEERNTSLPQTFSYKKPKGQYAAKAITSLCQTDIIRGAVQTVQDGGTTIFILTQGWTDFGWCSGRGTILWGGGWCWANLAI